MVELTLLGQNVNAYGADLTRGGDGPTFAGLLAALDGIEGLARQRFMTSHPKDLSDELIAAIAGLPTVCEHVHLPAQSGSDRVLAAMNRGYTRAGYLERVRALRAAVPDVALTTDLIAGFPGETDDDFEETLSLVERGAVRRRLHVRLLATARDCRRRPAGAGPRRGATSARRAPRRRRRRRRRALVANDSSGARSRCWSKGAAATGKRCVAAHDSMSR